MAENFKHSNLSNHKKSIKIILSDSEHDSIRREAAKANLSMAEYVKTKALDSSGEEMRCRQVSQLMPRFYLACDQIEEPRTRHELKEIGGAICRCLK